MAMLPGHGVGVAVFTNRDPSAVPEILANYVFDRVCGRDPGSIVFVSGAAKPWRSSTLTGRPGKRRGG
jgi:hypothetical protein